MDNCDKMDELGMDKYHRVLHIWNLSATSTKAYKSEVQAMKDAQAAKEAAAALEELKRSRRLRSLRRKRRGRRLGLATRW